MDEGDDAAEVASDYWDAWAASGEQAAWEAAEAEGREARWRAWEEKGEREARETRRRVDVLRMLTATHEAGHAVVAWALGHAVREVKMEGPREGYVRGWEPIADREHAGVAALAGGVAEGLLNTGVLDGYLAEGDRVGSLPGDYPPGEQEDGERARECAWELVLAERRARPGGWLVGDLEGVEEEVAARLALWEEVARRVVIDHWPRLMVVAHALLVRGSIGGEAEKGRV